MQLRPIYINLDERTDRRALIEEEFARLNITDYIRFPAIKNKNGAIGCLESHIQILEKYDTDAELLWICEDDAQFTVGRETLDKHIQEFVNSPVDILCLGFSSRKDVEYSELFKRSYDNQTTSSYIIKSGFRKVLLEFWKSLLIHIKELKINIHPARAIYYSLDIHHSEYSAADQAWKVLQQEYIFLIPKVHIIIQRAGYSDIENRYVNYNV